MRQHGWNCLEKLGGITIAHHCHETPRASQAGKGGAKISHGIGGFDLTRLPRNTHHDVPENRAHERSEYLAEDRSAHKPKKVKRFQLWKHSGRKKHEMIDMLLKGVGVVHSNGGTCIMTDDVPLLDAALDTEFSICSERIANCLGP